MLISFGTVQICRAQDVDVRLSTREAYVGVPIVLQISIHNAADYEPPNLPEIDGCEIRSAVTPSQSSQITIINGRRSESRSVTLQYLITPRRAGTFEIPSLDIEVDGLDQKTQPLRFVATKSDTGDLLFVEIEGGKDKVYVGQPLDLTLKIWIKPFTDRQKNITLSEAHMWQLISEQTSWGSFAGALQKMSENNQRPAGREVLRSDGHDTQRSYYLYEIEATVYPKRTGKIDADDVRIVVNYPTALGKSRDPFDEFFKDSPFGSSPLSRMMNDDLFDSPFTPRLTVSSSRPVVGEATVDATEVIPVPTAGRPADYRGAVGRYSIVTRATPATVNAGDPITLNIGIAGTGPMELVQAPPLSELPSLTNDFLVADQSLAGFVEDDTKLFSTTIRPRQEGITQIPPIPFSFFDPDSQSFETVFSESIPIKVEKAESLALDAIVGKSRVAERQRPSTSPTSNSLEPDLTNNDSQLVLVSQPAPNGPAWWLAFVMLPPLFWLATLLVHKRSTIAAIVSSGHRRFRSARAQCLAAIERASNRTQVENALLGYIARRTRYWSSAALGSAQESSLSSEALPRDLPTPSATIGELRTRGMYDLAIDVESFFHSQNHTAFGRSEDDSLPELRQAARNLIERLEDSFASMKKSHVRRPKSGIQPASGFANGKAKGRPARNSARKATLLLILAPLAWLACEGLFAQSSRAEAVESSPPTGIKSPTDPNRTDREQDEVVAVSVDGLHIQLTDLQRQTILSEASAIYSRATSLPDTDSAEANDLFSSAAEKYQLLVDSGIHNSQLYLNLGNAYLQSNQLGRAIANFERSKDLDPSNKKTRVNLYIANSLVKGAVANSTVSSGTWTGASNPLAMANDQLQSANETFTNLIGKRTVVWAFCVASVLFWGLLTLRVFVPFPIGRFAIWPFLILVLTATSYGLTALADAGGEKGIVVANDITLYSGDGKEFAEVSTLETPQGVRVEILDRRGNWTKIRTANGHEGWVNCDAIESL